MITDPELTAAEPVRYGNKFLLMPRIRYPLLATRTRHTACYAPYHTALLLVLLLILILLILLPALLPSPPTDTATACFASYDYATYSY